MRETEENVNLMKAIAGGGSFLEGIDNLIEKRIHLRISTNPFFPKNWSHPRNNLWFLP